MTLTTGTVALLAAALLADELRDMVAVDLVAQARAKPSLHIQQYCHEHGISADGCQTMADARQRVEMLRTIARGYQSRAIVIPHYSTTSFTYTEQERRKARRSYFSKNGHAKR